MAQPTWLLIEYQTTEGSSRFTVLPESALLNWQGEFKPDPLLKIFTKYEAVLGDLTPATFIVYDKLTAAEANPLHDAVTLCYLIDAHDLTFSYSDDFRYYASGRASLNRIHQIVHEDNSLAWFLWKLWNVKVGHGVIPDYQNQWLLTPAEVAAIAGDPSIKMTLVNQEMAAP